MQTLALFLLLMPTCVGAEEPAYRGQPLSFWFDELEKPAERREKERWTAASVLAELSPEDSNALPAILTRLKKRTVVARSPELFALRRIGPASVDALRRMLREEDDDAQVAALRALAELAPHSRCALPEIHQLLTHRKPNVRLAASRVVFVLEGKAADLVPLWREMLKSDKAGLMLDAARLLGRAGEHSKGAYDDLRTLLKDENEEVRRTAAVALARIDPTRKEPVEVLVAWLRTYEPYEDKDPDTEMLDALCRLGERAVPGLSALVKERKVPKPQGDGCQTPDRSGPPPLPDGPSIRAARILAQTGRNSPEAAEAMIVALSADEEGIVFRDCLVALGSIAVAPLIKALATRRDQSQQQVKLALVLLADLARPALLKSLRDRSPTVRADAAEILGLQGVVTEGIETELRRSLEDDDVGVAITAAFALYHLDPLFWQDAQAIAVKSLTNEKVEVRRKACVLLYNLGARDKDSMNALGTALTDKDDAVRLTAVLCLRCAGTGALSQVSALKRALKDVNESVRLVAAETLSRLDPSATEAIPVLLRTLEFETEGAPQGFEEALGKRRSDLLHSELGWANRYSSVPLWSVSYRSLLAYEGRVLPDLLDRLKRWTRSTESQDSIAYSHLQELLGELGKGDEPTINALTLASETDIRWKQTAVVQTLLKLDPANKDYQRLLIASLNSHSRLTDTRIEWHKEVIPDLLEAFRLPKDADRRVTWSKDQWKPHDWLFVQLARSAGLELPNNPPNEMRPVAEISEVLPILLTTKVKPRDRRIAMGRMWELNFNGPRRKDFVAALLKMLEKADAGLQLRIAEVLLCDSEYQARACELLNQGLTHKDEAIRHQAIRIIKGHELIARPFERNLTAFLEPKERQVRIEAMSILHTLDHADDTLLRELVKRLQSSENEPRWITIQALGILDPGGRVSGRHLESLIFEFDTGQRGSAMNALARQNRPLDSVLDSLVRLILIRSLVPETASGIWNFEPFCPLLTKAAFPALEAWFVGDTGSGPVRSLSDPALQEAMARWFAGMGEAGVPAVPLLRRAAQSPDTALREAALEALAGLEPTPDALRSYLKLSSHRKDSGTTTPFEESQEIVRRVRTKGKSLLPSLVALLKDRSLDRDFPTERLDIVDWNHVILCVPQPHGRAFVAVLLRYADKDSREATTALLAALKDECPNVRLWSAWALLRLNQHITAALPIVLERLQGTVDATEQNYLCAAVAAHPDHARTIVPVLLRLLRRLATGEGHMTSYYSFESLTESATLLQAIGQLGTAAKEAASLLHQLSKSPPASVTDPYTRLGLRWESAAALARVTGDTIPAVVVLKDMAKADVWPYELTQTTDKVGLKRDELATLLKPGLRSRKSEYRMVALAALIRADALPVKELEVLLQYHLDRSDPVEVLRHVDDKLTPFVPALKKARERSLFVHERKQLDILLNAQRSQ